MSCPCGKHRTIQGCRGAAIFRSFPRSFRVQTGKEGGKTRAVLYRDQVIARYRHLDREDAIWQAWSDAIHIGKLRGARARKTAA